MANPLTPAGVAASLAAWGYLGIFVLVFLGNMGVPVPEETVVLAAGFLAGRNILNVRWVLVVAFVSAVLGDNVGYWIGRTGGQRLLDSLSARSPRFERSRRLVVGFFLRYGARAVFFARFIGGVRFLAGPSAGAAGMPFWEFFSWNALGAAVWCSLMVAVGYFLGDEWERVSELVGRTWRWVLVALLILAVGILVWRRERSRSADRVSS